MCQDVESIDFEVLDAAAEEFYQRFLAEIGNESPMECQSRKDEKEFLRWQARRSKGRIQSIEEQNQILREDIEAHPPLRRPDGLTGSELSDLCDAAWKSHNWNELAKLYGLEPTEELFEQFEKSVRRKNAFSGK